MTGWGCGQRVGHSRSSNERSKKKEDVCGEQFHGHVALVVAWGFLGPRLLCPPFILVYSAQYHALKVKIISVLGRCALYIFCPFSETSDFLEEVSGLAALYKKPCELSRRAALKGLAIYR